MKTFLRVGIFYGITFIFTIVLSVIQQMTGIDAGLVVFAQFGPGLAALMMLWLFRGDHVKFTITFRGVPLLKYLGAVGIPLGISAILFLIYRQFIQPVSLPVSNAASFGLMLGGMVLGAFGEELGWRGYLQSGLSRRMNGVIAFVLVGILWGLWHVGNYANGPVYVLFFVLSLVGYSGVMAWLLQGTNYNVILACLFHFAVNAGFYILKDALADTRLIALNGLVWIALTAVIMVFNRKSDLQPQPKDAGA